jgi:hypothetical protein
MYQVPHYIDNNKVFIVQRSEIEGRLDPKMALYNRKVQHSLYPKVKLKDVLVCKPQYGASEPGVPRSSMKESRYIRITDIDENGLISHNELGATAKNIEDKYILGENDILIARSGATVGKAYIHKSAPYDCFFAGYLIRFIINTDKALPEYIFTYTQLNAYKEWVNAIQRPSGQPNINSEEYQSLEIPLPDIEKQQVIVDVIKSAYLQKKQKESEAQLLLDSIDSYILNELGITLPEIKTDLKSRLFIVNRSELEERLDPTVYKDGIKLISSKYDNIKLSSVASVNPTGSFKGKSIETPISFIPMEAIDEIYAEVSKQEDTTIENASGFTKFKEGDLLWAKITPCMQNGKSAIAKELTNGLGCGSTEFFIIRPKDKSLIIEYLHAILHMKCVRDTAKLYFGGSAGQQRVSSTFLKNFDLPLPPKEKQIEIINHVYSMRQQAKALQKEGLHLLEQTKKEVEQMIIGK